MKKKESSEKREINTQKSYIEGDANVEGGDFVGGDKLIGFGPEQVAQIVKNLSPSYRDPEKLDKALQKFQNYHKSLYEWKELHNLLDEIINSFNQFYSQVERLNASSGRPDIKDLRLLWLPVSKRVDELLEFAKSVKLIGKPFRDEEGQYYGERWVIEIFLLRNDLNNIFYPDEHTNSEISSRGKLFSFGAKPRWWDTMYELTRSFYHTAYLHLHWGDKKLRETATELYHLSESVFQRP